MKKSLFLALLLMGLTSTLAQVILIRELLVTFYGNELSIGIILANWLILEATGSFFLGRAGAKREGSVEAYVILQFVIAVFLPLAVYGTKVLKNMLGIPIGEMIGLFPVFYSSFLLLAPVALAGGAQFSIGCRIYSDLRKQAALSIARVYIYEAIGAMIGGLLLTLLIIPYFHSLEVAFSVSGLNLISAILLIVLSRKPSHATLREQRQTGMPPFKNILKRGAPFLVVGTILLASTGYLLFSPRADEIHSLSTETQWRGYDLQYYKNSNYGNTVVTKRGDEFTFYSDGIPIATTPNPDEGFVEELAHFPMLFTDSPDKVLVVGGGVGGLINELLKHPVDRIDYAELDPLIIEAIQTFPTPLTEAELNNLKVAIHHIDGRLFLSRSEEHYDVIIVNLPSPSTLQLNRFYTSEFFQAAATRLSDDGTLAITCPGSLSYLSEELANLDACVYYTMLDVFPYLRVIPGESNLFLASPSAEITTAEPALLIQRFQERTINTKLLSDFHIEYRMDEQKTTWFLESISRVADFRTNRDLTPSGLFYDISLWSALVSEFSGNVLKLMGKANIWVFLIPLVILTVAFFTLRRWLPKLEKTSAGFAIVATGFMGMAFSMVLILAFQSLFGYVYQMIALIIAAFMLGLAIGSTIISRLMNRVTNNKALLMKLEAVVVVYSALVPVVLVVFHAHLSQPAISVLVQVAILILSVIPGILAGAEFPLANKIYLKDGETIGKVGGTLYACDLIGSWVAALFVSIWLIPVLGILNTCILIACLKVVSLFLVATSRL